MKRTPWRIASLTAALAMLAAPALAQPQCLISAGHGTHDRSTSRLGNNILTVDEGGNWFLDLTFKCVGITNLSTHDPEILLDGITVDSSPLWKSSQNPRFSGDVWNRDGYGPTAFRGTDPAGDFTARVRLSGTSVDNNCHDTDASTRMQVTAKIDNTVNSTSMASRTFTVTARDDDPLTLTLSPGKPWGRTIDWKKPCS